ncbi:MAG: hypothetical protein K0S56_2049, partial [Microvirga sp.]|nr:hypothetical protein [Microvirga sp.]
CCAPRDDLPARRAGSARLPDAALGEEFRRASHRVGRPLGTCGRQESGRKALRGDGQRLQRRATHSHHRRHQDAGPDHRRLEGIAAASDGGFWLASEGNPERSLRNRLIRVDAKGAIIEEITLPAGLEEGAKNYGFEGVAVTGTGADEIVWLAVQREWADDPKGQVKLLAYTPADKSWGAVRYPLDKPEAGWIGLSEITALGDRVILIERDNQIAEKASVKKLYAVPAADMKPVPLAKDLPLVRKNALRDLLPDLKAPKGYVLDKAEGFAVDAAGDAFLVTDNDGVDESSGETQFLKLGKF